MDKISFDELVARLRGEIYCFDESLRSYCTDKSYLKGIVPAVVIHAVCAADVKEVLSFANRYKVPVTVRGAGSGKSGGAIPEFKGIVLSLEKMNKIIDVDINNFCIVVEPGVILDNLKQAVLIHNLFYPVETSSSDWCTIGGNVAENAGGANSLKYGVTADYVLALEGYFADGTFFKLGRKCHKDVAGYNLKNLLVGSEGTLAVITKITLKLIPKPKYIVSFWCKFDSMKKAVQFLSKSRVSGINFSAAEFMEPACLEAAGNYLQKSFDFLSGYAVLFSYDSDTKESIGYVAEFLEEMVKSHSYKGQLFVKNSASFWEVRRAISESLAFQYKHKFSEDITIPISAIPAYFDYIKSIQTSSIKLVGYGHLGDGNIHTNLLNLDLEETIWDAEKERLIDKIMSYCVSVGGTITGEHGIGLTKKKYMNLYFSDFEISLMKHIKKQVDPNMILNPSKMFSG
jgi:glycolate oxidase